MAQFVENLSAMQETMLRFLVWVDPLEKGKAISPVFWPGEFQGPYSSWVTNSHTQLSYFHFTSMETQT